MTKMQSTVISSPSNYLQKTIYIETDGDVGARYIRWKEIINLQDDKKVLIFMAYKLLGESSKGR